MRAYPDKVRGKDRRFGHQQASRHPWHPAIGRWAICAACARGPMGRYEVKPEPSRRREWTRARITSGKTASLAVLMTGARACRFVPVPCARSRTIDCRAASPAVPDRVPLLDESENALARIGGL